MPSPDHNSDCNHGDGEIIRDKVPHGDLSLRERLLSPEELAKNLELRPATLADWRSRKGPSVFQNRQSHLVSEGPGRSVDRVTNAGREHERWHSESGAGCGITTSSSTESGTPKQPAWPPHNETRPRRATKRRNIVGNCERAEVHAGF